MASEKNNPSIVHSAQQGSSLVEILIAVAVLSIVLLALMGTLTLTIKSSLTNTAKIQASFLEEEGLEAVRVLRDNGWTANIASQVSPFYLTFDGTTWKATAVNTFIDNIFEREVTITPVYRDSNKDIVSSGTLDTNAKIITVSVSWLSAGATTTKSLSTILTNIFNN